MGQRLPNRPAETHNHITEAGWRTLPTWLIIGLVLTFVVCVIALFTTNWKLVVVVIAALVAYVVLGALVRRFLAHLSTAYPTSEEEHPQPVDNPVHKVDLNVGYRIGE